MHNEKSNEIEGMHMQIR